MYIVTNGEDKGINVAPRRGSFGFENVSVSITLLILVSYELHICRHYPHLLCF